MVSVWVGSHLPHFFWGCPFHTAWEGAWGWLQPFVTEATLGTHGGKAVQSTASAKIISVSVEVICCCHLMPWVS